MDRSLFVGVGANDTGPCHAEPIDTCRWAIRRVVSMSRIVCTGISSFYSSEPIPKSDQPDYINAVIRLSAPSWYAPAAPAAFLAELHRIEAEAGRVRGVINAARPLDLDLLAVDDLVASEPSLVLPHPRLAERAFVLHPLCDIALDWRHPQLGLTAAELRDRLPPQRIQRLPDSTEDLLLRTSMLT